MNTKTRISALQELMRKHKLHGYIVPSSDQHQSEYVPLFWQRRPWISGFTGSVGDFALTLSSSALWVDGRYILQATRETKGSMTEVIRNWLPESPTIAGWFAKNLRRGSVVGVDPKVLSVKQYEKLEHDLDSHGIVLKSIPQNLVDVLWSDQPSDSLNKITVHPIRFAGESHASKLSRLRKAMADAGAHAHVLSALDSVAWLFNLRGTDVPCNPVFVAHAIVTANKAYLYTDLRKVDKEVRRAISKLVKIQNYDEFADGLRLLARQRRTVWLDPVTGNHWTADQLRNSCKMIYRESPLILMKALKNKTEIRGAVNAHIRDGVAVVKFLHWFSNTVAKQKLTELDMVKKLEEFRARSKFYRGPSFDTIAGAGPNGAVVHYRPTRETNRTIAKNSLVVLDSGGQYPDGTTDITRTLLVGAPTREMRERFTLMLKGNLALHLQSFPAGTMDMQLDPLARQFLWKDGLDYQHGTGHGIGSFLCVHEKPQIIGPRKDGGIPLQPGMIFSNEPGFYKAGEYGMRNENLVYVTEDKSNSSKDKKYFRLENLVLCPIETRLIEKSLLTQEEFQWINSYHAKVRSKLSRFLTGDERKWLVKVTRPI